MDGLLLLMTMRLLLLELPTGVKRRYSWRTPRMDAGLRIYVVKRLAFAVVMLLGVTAILFTLMRLAPGGPEAVLIGGEFSPEAAAQVRQRLGLDRPLLGQYAAWGTGAARGGPRRAFQGGDRG